MRTPTCARAAQNGGATQAPTTITNTNTNTCSSSNLATAATEGRVTINHILLYTSGTELRVRPNGSQIGVHHVYFGRTAATTICQQRSNCTPLACSLESGIYSTGQLSTRQPLGRCSAEPARYVGEAKTAVHAVEYWLDVIRNNKHHEQQPIAEREREREREALWLRDIAFIYESAINQSALPQVDDL
jgi:hypothetical protein